MFNVGLLEPYREDTIGRPRLAIPEPEIVNTESSYVVADVVDGRWYGNPKCKFPDRFVQYLVAWEAFGREDNSGEQFVMLEDTVIETLGNLENRYPAKPRDHRVVTQLCVERKDYTKI